MAKFSKKSEAILDTCHPDIIKVMIQVVKEFDITIISGHRTEEEQNALFNHNPRRSMLTFPHSKHNRKPSEAIDIAPYPVDWNDIDRFNFLGGYVIGIAKIMGIKLRWGGDWDRDFELLDERGLRDFGHFELIR